MENFKRKWKKLIAIYNIVDILAVLLFYPLIPKLLNYPPNSIDNSFQVAINGLTYTQQYISILILCIFIENIILTIAYKNISKLLEQMNQGRNIDKLYIKAVKTIENTPIIIYLLQVIAPVIIIAITFLILNGNIGVIIKVALVFFAMLLSVATISHVFAKRVFKDILIDLFYNTNKNNDIGKELLNKIRRSSIKGSVIFVVLPLLIVTIVFITFIGYSNLTKQKGDYLYKIYNKELLETTSNEYIGIEELVKDLNNLELLDNKDCYFIIYPNGKKYISNENENLSVFFIKYSEEVSKDNRTYGFYATDEEGVFRKITIGEDSYTIGIKYSTAIIEMIRTIIVVSIIILLLSIALLLYSLEYIFKDIVLVSKNLNKMAKSKKIDLNDRLPISSNDEISDLIKSFTNIQEKTSRYIEQIEQDQYTMQRQAQFAVLGEFAGGLAHDLNSPLSAVKLDISTLKKYIDSDKISTDEHIRAKLDEMLKNIDSSLNSMGNIIMGVRNQIRATGDTDNQEFALIDILEGIKLLFRSLFMKSNCQIEVDISPEIKLFGEKNKLDRVLGNLIKNCIDAYSMRNIKGIVKVKAKQDNEKTIISVSDEAGGINKEIKDKIFKEMKTTKGEKGTGFGLYYSNTIIESSFKGKMYFETQDGIGTTFFIEIPKNKEEM